MLKSIARKILPVGVRRVLHRFLAGSSQLTISYELAQGWPTAKRSSWTTPAVTSRFKKGLESIDIGAVLYDVDALFLNPIVQDNLEALSVIGLEEASLLDFGSGNGLYRLIFAASPKTARWKYTGADVNAQIVEFCRSVYPDTRFEIIMEGLTLPFQDGEFDIVFASGVVQYVKDHESLLLELKRITKEYIVITRLPVQKYNKSHVVLQTVRHGGGIEWHPMHVFQRCEIESAFARLGLIVLWRDYGSELFNVPGIAEPVVHNSYVLYKSRE